MPQEVPGPDVTLMVRWAAPTDDRGRAVIATSGRPGGSVLERCRSARGDLWATFHPSGGTRARAYRRLCAHRKLRDGGARLAGRFHRLVMLAPFRRTRLLCGASRHI